MADISKQSALAFNAEPSQSTFNFGEHTIRVVIRDGEPWFVASDVASALGYRDAANAGRTLKDRQKGTHSVSTLGGSQKLMVISEPGLYKLVLRSRKPDAEEFQDWVTEEVLPSIRKTGGYAKPTMPASKLSLDDAVRLDHAFHMATQAAAHVQREVFKCIMESKKPESLANQWLLYFHQKSLGDREVDAYCKPLAIDAICLGPDAYLANLERGDGHTLSTDQLARMAELSTQKLVGRVRQQVSKAKTIAA